MARSRKNATSIEDQIIAQENAVAKAKNKYDAEVAKLKDLLAKKDEMRRKQLIAAVENSEKAMKKSWHLYRGSKKNEIIYIESISTGKRPRSISDDSYFRQRKSG